MLFHCRTTSCLLDQQPLSATNKNELPALPKSNVIYQFPCHCHSRFVGRISQKLKDRMKNTSPNLFVFLCRNAYFLPVRANLPSSPTSKLLLLIQPLNRFLFHLSAIESFFTKTFNPVLCRPQKLVYSLQIVH